MQAFFPDQCHLTLGTPDILQESIALRQAVQAVVALATSPNETAKGIRLAFTGIAAILVNFADAKLDRSVVLSLDDTVRRAALAWDVAYQLLARGFSKNNFRRNGNRVWVSWGWAYRSTISPFSFSMTTLWM